MPEESVRLEDLPLGYQAAAIGDDVLPELRAQTRDDPWFSKVRNEIADDLILGFLAYLQTNGAFTAALIEPTLQQLKRHAHRRYQTTLPSPSDLVRFELREVFRPEDRASQLDPPPSETFVGLMADHGFTKYHAESYWAAHWDLPGLEKGFEMLHRLRPGRVGAPLVFSADDMRELLRKQDVLPLYHERLMAVSYAPLTRVDVRRMFKLGVLSKTQVAEAYKDLGYDDVNAGFLADFTEKDVQAEERELTRGDWVASYREGLVPESDFRAALIEMGYSTGSVDRIVALEKKRAETQVLREMEALDRKILTLGRRVRRASRSGTLDEEVARAELEDLGLDDLTVQRFFMTYKAKPLPKAKDLTRAEELAAFRYGVTTEAEIRERLATVGLDSAEIERLIQTEKAKLRKPETRARELSKTDITSLLKKGILSPEEAVERLTRLGYTEADASALVTSAAPVV